MSQKYVLKLGPRKWRFVFVLKLFSNVPSLSDDEWPKCRCLTLASAKIMVGLLKFKKLSIFVSGRVSCLGGR